MKKTMKKFLSNVIALSLVVANAMTLTVLPSYAEETENVETGSVIELTMKPTNYAFAGYLEALSAMEKRTLVNTSIITREESNNSKRDLFKEPGGIYLFTLYYYPSFEISNAYAVTDIKLNITKTGGIETYVNAMYSVSDEFILEGTETGEYYDSEESDLYETVSSYAKSSPDMTQLGRYSYGQEANLLGVMDISDKIISDIKTEEENSGKAVLNLALRADSNLSINAGTVSLTVTYDKGKILEKFQSELANASTAEAVKAVVEDFDNYVDVDTDILSNMDYVYADIAKTTATTVYTFESLAEAIENRAKAYIKEITILPDNYALRNWYDGSWKTGIAVNTNILSRSDGQLREITAINLKTWEYLSAYNLDNTDAIRKMSLNTSFGEVITWLSFYATPVSSFPVSTEPAFYGTDAPEHATLVDCIKKDLVTKVNDGSVYSNTVASIDYSSKLEALNTVAGEDNSAVLLVGLSSQIGNGGGAQVKLFEDSLKVTYDMTVILDSFNAELMVADTAEKVQAVAEKYNDFMGADLDTLANMDYVYADIAKTTATTVYTFESLAEAIENRAKAYIKEITILPDNYALRNWYDGSWQTGIAVNTNILLRSDGQLREITAINLKHWRYLSAYNLSNTDAIRKMSLNTSFGDVGSWVNFYATPVSSFPVSTEPAFYGTDAPEHATLVSYIEKDRVANVADGSVYANTVANIDYSSKIEELNTVAGDENSAVLLAGVSSEIGRGGAQVKLFEDSLNVTYDMTAVYDNYNADFAAIENAADVKALVENYNDFIGADLSQLKNMDVIYAELFENISEGTVYSIDTLKAAIDEMASKYIYVVEYDKPTDYYVYKRFGMMDGVYGEDLVLVNSNYLRVTAENNKKNQYGEPGFVSTVMDSYYAVPIVSYDIYNPQAVVDVKFTTSARRRADKDGEYSSSKVAWNVSDADLTDAKAGRYFDDADSTTDVFDTIKAWYDTNKGMNQTEYAVPTVDEFKADSKTVHTTTMDIPKAVIAQMEEKTAPTNLVITYVQNNRNLTTGVDNNKLTVTYDLSAVNEADKEFIVKGYNKFTTTEDKLSLVDDGARVELVQMKKDVPTSSKAIIALYNDGVLVKTGFADVTAPGFMKKTVLELTGFSDVTYDELKVMTWDGISEMKPLANSFEIR